MAIDEFCAYQAQFLAGALGPAQTVGLADDGPSPEDDGLTLDSGKGPSPDVCIPADGGPIPFFGGRSPDGGPSPEDGRGIVPSPDVCILADAGQSLDGGRSREDGGGMGLAQTCVC